ncbi:carbohydrate ABC transporter substrate-binding protein, CUT1 family [Natronobacterium gregoryi]|uniref:ABC-type sugar transport system, periplasmic component n=2 Tax=Natronobacterium gregoryi TaxID=44930 RepID=L0ANT6_NATGS|nr:ABC-type sugar transport system, periplasmic component [Natronobacterium gregoryi SP2]PLK20982.1 carbohydrate ABC transporter substrate-binding protein [Natronobacterium gregoryi SP2]SFJ03629.1 carbohydrate ABC transporter substrate-binding protein, CUT1 family [Natronobacterium gregoryi]
MNVNKHTEMGKSRRSVLQGIGAAGIVGLAGCLGGDDDVEDLGELLDEDTDEFEPVEIGHWWTAGGEEDAFEALVEGFEQEHPDIEVDSSPSPGGAGSALEADIRNRVVDQSPPSTFQVWPGQALTDYTDEDLLYDIEGHVWDDDMREAYLDGPIEASRPHGDFVAVPINIHRLNNLFYNVDVVEDAGVDLEDVDSPSALLDAMEAVDEAGYVGMAQQTQTAWSTLQLWAQVLLGEYGVDTYETFIAGDVEDVEAEVRDTLEIVVDYSDYFNEDASSLNDWDDASAYVNRGEAAFFHQGDWAAGEYEADDDLEYGEDWDHVAFPGTEEMYALNMDSFVFPKHNPSPNATVQFLRYAGSADAQERFNPAKGSIPPRTDVSDEAFTPFLQDQMADFQASSEQPPSIAHGLAVPPAAQTDVEGAFANFIDNWDVDETYDELVNSFE